MLAALSRPIGASILLVAGVAMVIFCRRLGAELARRVSGGGTAVIVVLASGLFFVALGVVGLAEGL